MSSGWLYLTAMIGMYGVANLLQSMAAARTSVHHTFDPGLLVRLAGQRTYLLGIAWAQGLLTQCSLTQWSLRGRRVPALMLAGGAAATAALIAWAGYPASMVGVNGAHISNLNPPTLAAVAFGVAQCGLALLLHDRLARLMRRPLAWAGIALVNLSAMTLFLWHQTAFVTVSSVGLLIGRVPGLLTAPTGGLWVAERLAWLPVFAIVLSGLWLAFRRMER